MARRTSPGPNLPGFETLPLLLQAEEVAQLIRVSRKAVYTMAERGEIPGVTKPWPATPFPPRRDRSVARYVREVASSMPLDWLDTCW